MFKSPDVIWQIHLKIYKCKDKEEFISSFIVVLLREFCYESLYSLVCKFASSEIKVAT